MPDITAEEPFSTAMAFNNPKPRASSTGNPSGSSSGRPDRGGLDSLIKAEKMTQIAFILPAAVLVGWLVGAGLDRWLHTGWIYIVGILLGVAAGFVQIFRLVGAAGASIDRAANGAGTAGIAGATGQGVIRTSSDGRLGGGLESRVRFGSESEAGSTRDPGSGLESDPGKRAK